MTTYVIDLAGTLCTIAGLEYDKAQPIKSRINHINRLYDEGNRIVIQTARGFTAGTVEDLESVHDLTYNQLVSWGIRFHDLSVGAKMPGDIYIDDKAINAHVYFDR